MDIFDIIVYIIATLLCDTVQSIKIDHRKLEFSWKLEGNVRSSTHSLSIEECWSECKERTSCYSVNYHRQSKKCEFNTGFVDDNAGRSLSRTKGWVYYQNADEQKCSDGTNTCPIKECPPIYVPNGYTKGNMLTVGSKVLLGCNEGFMSSSGFNATEVSECSHLGVFTLTISCFPVTCQEIGTSGFTVAGAYKSYDSGSGEVIDIFCDFLPSSNTGYTFLSKSTLRHVTSLSNHYSRLDHVIIRHYKTTQTSQYSSSVSVLSRYRSQYPDVSVFLSEHPDFTPPTASDGQYIYMGFVPVSFGDHKQTWQGYACDGNDKEFFNCDGNANNYFVLHENKNGLIQKNGCCSSGQNGIAIQWQSCATIVDSSRNMDLEFFYDTYEMHMGGCGVLTKSNIKHVGGIAFGLPFDF